MITTDELKWATMIALAILPRRSTAPPVPTENYIITQGEDIIITEDGTEMITE